MLDIPLHRANFSNEYWNNVFQDFLKEHEKGRTPNPDVLCNREIKFKSFLDYAFKIGADYIATGHYASIINKDNRTMLSRASDLSKDQTYFLHEVSEDEFKKTIFPLSKISKTEVRKIANKLGLSTADKKDSVGICFIGERNLKDFLGRFLKFYPGAIRDEFGNIIGEHNGAMLYTEGQRQGLMIGGVKGREELPWYVYKKDIPNNEIYVCQGVDNNLLMSKRIEIDSLHKINDIDLELPLKCSVQVRHLQKPISANLSNTNGIYFIDFNEPVRAAAPGQSAVIYDENICIGGGIISKSF
jgi:tRNA-specific 2-thiouridylase